MRLVVEVSQLSRVLSFVRSCLPSKSTIPILQHVLFTASGSTLTVRAINFEREASASCPAQMDDEGSVTLPGEMLCAIVSGLSSGAQVAFTTKSHDKCEVVSGASKFTLRTLDTAEFPSLGESMEESISFEMDAGLLSSLLSDLSYASETEIMVRPDLYGVRIYREGPELVFVAMDMKRLARRTTKAPSGTEDLSPILIPLEAVSRAIPATLKEIPGDVLVRVGTSLIEFSTPTSRLAVKLMGQAMPDYLRLKIPTAEPDFLVHPVVLKEAVDRAQQVYTHSSMKLIHQECHLVAADDRLLVLMGDPSLDCAREEVEATVRAAKKLCLDVKFLSDMLRRWPEDGELSVYQEGPGKPTFFTSEKYPSHLAMIGAQSPKYKLEKEAA